jgi:hypothetical protein
VGRRIFGFAVCWSEKIKSKVNLGCLILLYLLFHEERSIDTYDVKNIVCAEAYIRSVCLCVRWRRECEMSTMYVTLVKAVRSSYELETKTLQEKDHSEELKRMGCYY